MANRVTKVEIVENEEIEYIISTVNSSDEEEVVEKYIIDDAADEKEQSELIEIADGQTLIAMDQLTAVEHVCGKCAQTFTNHDIFKRHISICRHSNEPKFSNSYPKTRKLLCFCCDEDKVRAHQGSIPCQECDIKFNTPLGRERHKLSLHAENSKFKCKSCTSCCPTKGILDLHMQTHAPSKPFVCDECGRDFTRKYHLERHLKYTSCGGENEQDVLPCAVCGKKFTRMDNLREHLRRHMGQTAKKLDFQCPYCEKSFYVSSLLNIHIRTHTGEKPFPCDICQKSFSSTGALHQHRRTHTGEKPFSCDICQKLFSSTGALRIHRRRTHTGERSHLRVHSIEDPFICEICSKQFIRFDCLLQHIRAVHREVLLEIITEGERKRLKFINSTVIAANVAEANSTTKKEEQSKSGDEEIKIDESCNDYEGEDDGVGEEDADTVMFEETISDAEDVKPSVSNKLAEIDEITFMDDATLKKSIVQLLNLLVDEETLSQFGWPETGVEEVLISVIKQCGHKPVDYTDCADYTTKMRENTKLLFTVVIDNDLIKSLLNSHTIDEVILQVLKMAQNKCMAVR